jgi:hypothetical protein
MTLATSKNLTILGIAMIAQALASAATALFDGDPATVIDFGLLANALIAGVGLILAKGAQTTGGTVNAAGVKVG